MSIQTVSVTFQDPSGAPIAGGKMTAKLQQDAMSSDNTQVCAKEVSAVLDANGTAVLDLWLNTDLTPSTFYFVRAYTDRGQIAWDGQMTFTFADVVSDGILQEAAAGFFLIEGTSDIVLIES